MRLTMSMVFVPGCRWTDSMMPGTPLTQLAMYRSWTPSLTVAT